MLLKCEISGFKSFNDTSVVNFEASDWKYLTEINVHNQILKGGLFIGANASGKSNTILAIKLLLDLLFGKYDVLFWKYICKFSDDKTTNIQYDFIIDNKHIEYVITFEEDKYFYGENLTLDGETLLDRKLDKAIDNLSDDYMVEDIPRDILFLRDIYFNTKFRGNEVLKKWFEFLKSSIYIDLYSQKLECYNQQNLHTSKYIEEYGTQEINKFFTDNKFPYEVIYKKEENIILFYRKDTECEISFKNESLGMQNLLMILPKILYVISNGGMLLVDEFSSGFHNGLEELIVKYFMENSKNSQIMIVSHSTNLLNNALLRPDQIYITELKGKTGTTINRLSSEDVRLSQNTEKMYLGGVFGGLPKYKTDI